LEARLSTPPPLPPLPPSSPSTEELLRIERRRRGVVRARRYRRLRTLLVILLLAGAGFAGFLVGKAYTQAPGPELKTSDRGLKRVTLTQTVATRTITVVTGK
jgi:hypothetical protein